VFRRFFKIALLNNREQSIFPPVSQEMRKVPPTFPRGDASRRISTRNLLFSCCYPFIMKSSTVVVEDTEENRQICRKYCGVCPTFRYNSLEKSEPDSLFCARGTSAAPTKKEVNCFCPACELFDRNNLVIGHFCARR
jgi:hypothetical protein